MKVADKDLREKIKEYIDRADAKVVKMVHALLEVDASVENEWWETLPENVKQELEASIAEADAGNTFTHEEVKEKHPQWFTK